jgi:hypothetical protein
MGAIKYPSPPSSFICEYVELIKEDRFGHVAPSTLPTSRLSQYSCSHSVSCCFAWWMVKLYRAGWLSGIALHSDVVGSNLDRDNCPEVLNWICSVCPSEF